MKNNVYNTIKKIKESNKNLGITLIALVITIVILLIISTAAITLLINNNLMGNAKTAVDKYNNLVEDENYKLAKYNNQVDVYGTRDQISKDELRALIREEMNSISSNPISLLSITLPSTNTSARGTGTYYSSTTSAYSKSESDNFSKYLEKQSDGKYKVLKSGNYLISAGILGHPSSGAQVELSSSIVLNGNHMCIAQERGGNEAATMYSNLTIFMEEGSVFDFAHTIRIVSCTYNCASFYVSALFNAE